jgi:hypothetical protein
MHSEVSVQLTGNQEFRFDLEGQEPMTHEGGRRWLDDQFTALDCEPQRASGKVLLADKVLTGRLPQAPRCSTIPCGRATLPVPPVLRWPNPWCGWTASHGCVLLKIRSK